MRRVRGALAGLVLALAAVPGWADSINVFAAASLQGALDEVAQGFRESTGTDVRVSYGPSGTLARQVERGAPADVFICADEDWARYLADKSLLAGPPKNLLANELVLIAPADSKVEARLAPGVNLLALLNGKRLVIANPTTSPAGRYAKAALTSAARASMAVRTASFPTTAAAFAASTHEMWR